MSGFDKTRFVREDIVMAKFDAIEEDLKTNNEILFAKLNKLSAKVTHLEEENTQLGYSNNSMETHIKELQTKMENLEGTVNTLMASVSALVEENTTLRSANSSIGSLTNEVSTLKEERKADKEFVQTIVDCLRANFLTGERGNRNMRVNNLMSFATSSNERSSG